MKTYVDKLREGTVKDLLALVERKQKQINILDQEIASIHRVVFEKLRTEKETPNG